MSQAAIAVKSDANRVGILAVFIDEQQSPVAVRANNRIAGDKSVAGGVFDSDIDGVEAMHRRCDV